CRGERWAEHFYLPVRCLFGESAQAHRQTSRAGKILAALKGEFPLAKAVFNAGLKCQRQGLESLGRQLFGSNLNQKILGHQPSSPAAAMTSSRRAAGASGKPRALRASK